MLGLEIRKKNTIGNLYADVDKTLLANGLKNGEVSVELQSQAVAHSLQKMLKPSSHFSICTIRECIEVSKIVIPQERMDVYHSIHCVHWSEMLQDFRQMIIAMVLDDFRSILNPNNEQTSIIEI